MEFNIHLIASHGYTIFLIMQRM